jgi:dolichyl-phosphate-mannose-protein mannosyltransferase
VDPPPNEPPEIEPPASAPGLDARIEPEPVNDDAATAEPAVDVVAAEPAGDLVAAEPAADLVAALEAWGPPARVRLRPVDLLVLAAILLAAGVTYFARLSEPGPLLKAGTDAAKQCIDYPPLPGAKCYQMIPLDEVHYVPDARDVVRFGTESDARIAGSDGAYVVHPPVAKWFIAAGIRMFGDRPFGWRFFGAIFGLFGILLIYLIALRLWRAPWWAALAAFLLACDGMWFVQSRVAMLDVYVAVFFLAGVWLLLKDRDRAIGEGRAWRVLGGVALGLSLASKMEIVWMFIVLVFLAFWWDRERDANEGAARHAISRLASAGAALILVPATVYVLTFTPWFLDSSRYSPPLCVGKHKVPIVQIDGRFGNWFCYQHEVLNFHRDLQKYDKGKPAHPYFGNGYSWPWLGRPVAHYYEATNAGKPNERRMEVLGLPNPLVWWPAFFLGFPLLFWWTIRRKDEIAPFIFAMFLAGFAPNALFDTVRRPVFLFYATPLVPFVCLAVVHLWARASARWGIARTLAAAHAVVALLAFAYFYPVLSGWPLSAGGFFGWQGRMWLNGDCGVADKIRLFCWI